MNVCFQSPALSGGSVSLPFSKSIYARAAILRYVYGNETEIAGVPDCDDSRELCAAMRCLDACQDSDMVFQLGNGGTSFRFFLALVASIPGFKGIVDCGDALRHRPVAPLVNALRAAGADIESVGGGGLPPYRVRGRSLNGSLVRVDASLSSQFESALILVSDLWEAPYAGISDSGESGSTVSRPYVEMSRRMLGDFRMRPEVFAVERDWSAAAFFYERALLNPGYPLLLEGLSNPQESLQGDSQCAGIFKNLGVSTRIVPDGLEILGDPCVIKELKNSAEHLRFDMRNVPDLVPPLVVGMCYAGIRFEIFNVGHLRHKESDRIAALVDELSHAGFLLRETDSSLSWLGERKRMPDGSVVTFDSHADHRIAMSLAVAALPGQPVEISRFEAVDKSFPAFCRQLPSIGIKLRTS